MKIDSHCLHSGALVETAEPLPQNVGILLNLKGVAVMTGERAFGGWRVRCYCGRMVPAVDWRRLPSVKQHKRRAKVSIRDLLERHTLAIADHLC